jgi:N-methylhydantoinase A
MASLDMGGTSTDVAFRAAGGTPAGRGAVPEVAGHPVAVPSLDIHTIGCGGGSLLEVDAGGVLHVVPASAGADPGPVCYGASDRPTLTDAHVLLGHIAPGSFLGGRLELDTDGVARAFERLAKRLGVHPTAAAQGALDVARAAMRRAVGVMTMQRGQDPQSLPLVAFGGAGGLHAVALARSLGMAAALIPDGPGVLSALGMATAEAVRDRSETLLCPLARSTPAHRRRVFARLARAAVGDLRDAGHAARSIDVVAELDLRYEGQSFELRLPDTPGGDEIPRLVETFHCRHEELYGYRLEDRGVELVNARVRALVPRPAARPRTARARPMPKDAVKGERRVLFDGGGPRPRAVLCPVIDRAELTAGHRLKGPAVVEEFSGTTVIPPGARADVTAGGHLRVG